MNSDAALRAQTDPFTVANLAILSALKAWGPLAAVVRGGNWTSTVPRPDAVDADRAVNIGKVPTSFPGVLLTQSGFLYLPGGRNSKTVDLRQDFTIQWATDVLNVVGLNVVKWQTFLALVAAGDTIAGSVWNNVPFIRTVNVRDAQEGMGIVIPAPDQQGTGGKAGWVATFVVSLDMFFDRSTVLTANP